MEDLEAQKRIWQRVTAPGPRGRETGAELLLSALELLALYRQLGAQPLAEAQSDTVACLKGLIRLAGGAVPNPRLPPQGKEPREKLLRTCYRRSRTACAEYLARSADPETGIVFRLLSDREGSHCAQIAALLGKL